MARQCLSPASWNGTGPAWTRGEIEKPAGMRDMGTWQAAVYNPEQQHRLGVDEYGNPRRTAQVGQQLQGGAADSHDRQEVWLQAWEERLKWREAAVKEAEVASNTILAKSRATPCLSLSCAACKRTWSDRGMQVMLVNDPDSDLYQADRQPEHIYEAPQDKSHRLCRCRVHDLFCECRLNVGYHVAESCAECSMNVTDLDAEHEWYFYADNTIPQPRRDPVTGETIMWPGIVIQTCSSDYMDGGDENQSEQPGQDGYIDGTWQCSPLADRNGRNTRAGMSKKEASLEQREDLCRKREAEQLDEQTRQFEQERYLKDATAEVEKQEEIVRDQFANLALREKGMDEREGAVVTKERELAERVANQERAAAEDRARAWKEAAEAQAQAQHAVNIAKEQAEKRAKDAKLAVQQAQANVLFAEAEAESMRKELAGQTQAADAAKAHAAEMEQQNKELRRIVMEEHIRQEERRRSSSRGPLPRSDEVGRAEHLRLIQLAERNTELEQQLSMAHSQLVEATAKCAALEREKSSIQVQATQLHDRLKIKDAEIGNLKSRDSPARGINDSSDDFEYIQTRLARVQQLSEKRVELSKWQDSLALRERTLAKAQDELDRREVEMAQVEDALGFGHAGALADSSSRFLTSGRHYTRDAAGGIGYYRVPDGSGVPPLPAKGGLASLLFCLRRRA